MTRSLNVAVLVIPVVILAVGLLVPGTARADFSLRGGWDLEVGGRSGSESIGLPQEGGPAFSIFWVPKGADHLMPLFGAGFRRTLTPTPDVCFANCPTAHVNSTLWPVSVGLRWHIGDLNLRKGALYLEFSPSLVSLRESYQGWWADELGTRHHVLWGLQMGAAAPIRISDALSLELGAHYLWTEDYTEEDTDGRDVDLPGFSQVTFQIGMGFR